MLVPASRCGLPAAGGNRGYLLDPSGRVSARYEKIHLFDVDLGEGKEYRESETISPGATAVVADTPRGGLGLSICYDLRFARLYRSSPSRGRPCWRCLPPSRS